MYLESIDLSFIQPCTTDSKRIRIMSNLNKNISDIFPYLNSYIKTGIYNLNCQFKSDKLLMNH